MRTTAYLRPPHFYDPVAASGTRYSFTGAITAPRQVLNGGYISFVNQGAANHTRSLREFIDHKMAGSKLTTTLHISKAPTNIALLDQIATVRATMCSRSKAHSTR